MLGFSAIAEFSIAELAPLSTSVSWRALILDTGVLREILDAELGTGKKPIVLLNGELKQRATTEGSPLVIGATGDWQTMPSGDTLLI